MSRDSGCPQRSRAWLRSAAAPLGVVIVLNVAAWGMLAGLAGRDITLLGIGAMAYFLGLRHAFDADHIAAIDNVTRTLREDGRRCMATGLYFSLGHSTVVILLSLVLAVTARATAWKVGALQGAGGLFGTLVSALFLTIIGLVNLRILIQLLHALRRARDGVPPGHAEGDRIEAGGGPMSRLFAGLQRRVRASWQMYPVGFLFGLGFDTATEIAILGLAAGMAQHGRLGLGAVMVFPLLFTAGMSLMDTLDGLVMLRVYDWAMADRLRKLFFNTTITGLGVLVALMVGGIEWLQLMANRLGWTSGVWALLRHLDFSVLGLLITVLMLATWGGAALYYRRALRPLESSMG